MEKLSLPKPKSHNCSAADPNLETPGLLAACIRSGFCWWLLALFLPSRFYIIVMQKGPSELEAE